MAAVTFADKPLDAVTDEAEVDIDMGHVDDDGGGGIESGVGVLTGEFNMDDVELSMALLLVTVPF